MLGRTGKWFTRTVGMLLAASWVLLYGDQEAGNTAHVQAAKYGRCYAKAVPAELYGGKGTTNVFRVANGRDILLTSYDWFSQRILLSCNVSDDKTPAGVSLIRLGPWPRGKCGPFGDRVLPQRPRAEEVFNLGDCRHAGKRKPVCFPLHRDREGAGIQAAQWEPIRI